MSTRTIRHAVAERAPLRVALLERGVYVLSSETADVYFATRAADGTLGAGRFLGSIRRGDVCVGVGAADSRGAFLAKSSAGVRLRPIGNERSQPARADAAVRRWITAANTAPLRGSRPPAFIEALPGERLTLPEGCAVGSGARLVWLQLDGAEGFLFGRRSGVSLVTDGPWPLAPHEWLAIQSAGEARVLDTEEAARCGLLSSALLRHASRIAALLEQDEAHLDQVERRRIHSRAAADVDLIRASASELASLLQPEAERVSESDSLNAVIARVASENGISITFTAPPARRPMVQLRAAAQANGFRLRRIAFRGAWWVREGPPLLGSRIKGNGGKPTPVALLPSASGPGYRIWQHGEAEKVVEGEIASELGPFGYAFYRPMPESPGRVRTLLAHGLRGCGRDAALLLALGIAAGGLAAMAPVITGSVYDTAIPEADRSQLGHLIALVVSASIAAALFQFVRALAVLRIETRLDDALQSGVWDHLLTLPATFFRKYAAGDLATRASGIEQIRQLMSGAATAGLLTGIFACWYLALLLYYDLRLALWGVAFLAATIGVSVLLALLQLRHQRRATLIQSRLSGLVLQLVTGLSKLRVAGAEVRAFARWAHRFAAQRRASVAGRRYANVLASVQATIPLALLAITYTLAIDGGTEMSTGEFLAFQTALLALAGAASQVTGVVAAGAIAMPLFEQLRPILNEARETDHNRTPPGELSGDVEIRRVTFGYGEDTPPVLVDVSIRANPGEFIALVGPSGSGKSSLLRLLLGFESPTSGAVYVDGQDLSGLDLHAVRRQMGVVLQEAGLLTGDIYTNIAGSSDATLDDAWEAARMAGLEDEIRAMPMGMHTVLNQNGTTISGGQRQRLMIARAVVNRPRILLFDEATSALDNVTQDQVGRSLSTLQATRIVVAHRLSTVVNADRIYVLDRGQVVEEGTFDDLMKRRGLFFKLSRRQVV